MSQVRVLVNLKKIQDIFGEQDGLGHVLVGDKQQPIC